MRASRKTAPGGCGHRPAGTDGPAGYVIVAWTLLATACGQFAGVHREPLALREAAFSEGERGALDARNNGENAYPPARLRYTVVTIRKGTAVRAGVSPFALCPVQGEGFFTDDFGAPRFSGGYHPHAGNDIFADYGTPVVAPFDGVAAATPNDLGGMAVKVYGVDGYVYNAHLAGYGELGRVRAGTVIGYVGDTGNARGGHDHFEWHPDHGPAVNPYPYLKAACQG